MVKKTGEKGSEEQEDEESEEESSPQKQNSRTYKMSRDNF